MDREARLRPRRNNSRRQSSEVFRYSQAAQGAVGALRRYPRTEEDVPCLVKGTLRIGSSTLVAAKPKVGESSRLMTLALAVDPGAPFLGQPTKKGRVVRCAGGQSSRVGRTFRETGATKDDDLRIYIGQAPQEAMKWLREKAMNWLRENAEAPLILLARKRPSRGEPAQTMTDKDEILAAIAGLKTHVDESVNALAGITKAGFERVEKRLDAIETDVGELKTAVDRIETKLGPHETRIEDVETKVTAVETRVKALEARPVR